MCGSSLPVLACKHFSAPCPASEALPLHSRVLHIWLLSILLSCPPLLVKRQMCSITTWIESEGMTHRTGQRWRPQMHQCRRLRSISMHVSITSAAWLHRLFLSACSQQGRISIELQSMQAVCQHEWQGSHVVAAHRLRLLLAGGDLSEHTEFCQPLLQCILCKSTSSCKHRD